MAWNDGLSDEQQLAAGHAGTNARLLAGPGTGKTHVIARHVVFLIAELGVDPAGIVVLTFTRAAAAELRERVAAELGCQKLPRISTLHAFALRQLLRNSPLIEALPKPLRIADDWEERYIVLEDIKRSLKLARIADARELFSRLASDWESLAADEPDWKPEPAFLGAWRGHRERYGYTLRAELVYQLKRAMEQIGDFRIEEPFTHLIVDEYQDLNKCDLAVIRCLVQRGVELFAAGDDDQSIYGFRKAFPEGIRDFPLEYPDAIDRPLEVCRRCDPEILGLGEFVASLDPNRIHKHTRAEEGRAGGVVRVARFRNQGLEAAGIADSCAYLIGEKDYRPDDILILLRSDWRGAFSEVLAAAMQARGVPVATESDVTAILEEEESRLLLAGLRLATRQDDDLAWRTVFQVRTGNRLGEGAIQAIDDLAAKKGSRFAAAMREISANPELLPRYGLRVQAEVAVLDGMIAACPEDVTALIEHAARELIDDDEMRARTVDTFTEARERSSAASLSELLVGLESVGEGQEQELERGAVNILTMHRAKGLTAKAVFVAAAEDEHIPGRQQGEHELGDERRLLYVSLTRAKHQLIVSYCQERTGRQMRLGRSHGSRRSLTRFLIDAPVHPIDGSDLRENLQDA